MTRETDTVTDPCPRCFGRGAIFMGPNTTFCVCPDCRGTGSAVVKQYAEWAIAAEREACAKLAETAAGPFPGVGLLRPCAEIAAAIRARGAEGTP